MKFLRAALATLSVLATSAAFALPVSESGDAGSFIGSAQLIGGNVTSISGATGGNDREDLYRFNWGGGLFQASTNGSFGSSRNFDTMLFLFGGNGLFITANDDSAGGLGSFISATLGAGEYLLGISGFSNDALNVSGQEFRFGGTGTLVNWQGGGSVGSYTIGINAPTANAVPEPASLALVGLGIFGLAAKRRRQKFGA